MKCGVWSVECGVWSVKFGVRRVQCEVWSVECEVWSVECEECSVKCEVRSVECDECSVKCGVWSVKCGVRRVHSVKCGVRSANCEVELRMWHVKQDTTFAECTHARAWLAHGACKFYRWESSYIYISLRQLPPRLVRVLLVYIIYIDKWTVKLNFHYLWVIFRVYVFLREGIILSISIFNCM